MFFPDDYEFCGSKESVRKQIGMAVPCKGAQVIFEAILKTFAQIDYETVEAKFPPWKNDGDSSKGRPCGA
ncbi:MAG: DNA cytosine methyltransferase [Puniceicoccales bacterium]|nr:DNA cytosine methyltransferase [Puniceicoccales bacterium]